MKRDVLQVSIAAAIANARGGRRGVPQIRNIMEMLPPNLREDVMADADAVIDELLELNVLKGVK
jgi:hypothetical protein